MAEFTTSRWWQPGKREMELPGVLFQDIKRGWLLRLDGSFESPQIAAQGESKGPTSISLTLPTDYPILQGMTNEGRFITLFGCQVLGGTPPLWSNAQLSVWPTILAYDVHFESVEDFTLTSLSMRYSNLDGWATTSGFAVNFSPSLYPVEVRYSRPEPLQVELADGLTLSITFAVSGPSIPALSELHIVQRAWAEVKSNQGRRYDDLLRLITRFSDLIALAIGQPLRPLEM